MRLLREVDELQWDVRKVVEGVMGTMRRRRRRSTTSSSSPELRSGAAAVSRAKSSSWVYIGTRESGGAGFLRLGGKCGAGGGRNRAAGEVAALAVAEGVVAAWGGVGDACLREEGPRGRPGGLGGLPRVHLAADAPWTRSTGGVRASGGVAEG